MNLALTDPQSLTSSSYTRKHYEEIVEEILNQITEGLKTEPIKFIAAKLEYELKHPPKEIKSVEGTSNGRKETFRQGIDYVFAEHRKVLTWTGTKPDNQTEFRVTYSFVHPSGLTDTHPGSVLRTIVEAVSKELEHLYDRMDSVYNAAFIGTARGEALDNVVAAIGMKRKQAARAMGTVTFWRDSNPADIVVSGETILFDGRDQYSLGRDQIKAVNEVNGKVKAIDHKFKQGTDFDVDTTKNSILWLMGGTRPDKNTAFSVDYIIFEKIVVPAGTLVSTEGTSHAKPILFETTKEAILTTTGGGKWQADVQVIARLPGVQGNIIAGAIKLMPKAPVGVERVMNNANFSSGTDLETDELLRDRAKNALEVAGKATMGSLKTTLESIEGIKSTPRIKENPDGILGLIKVVIDGGKDEDIMKAIEETRAAGVRVEFQRPKVVSLDFELVTVPSQVSLPPARLNELKSAIERKIKDFVSALKIDDDLVYYQLLSSIVSIDGIRDVKQLTIDVFKEGALASKSLKENIVASEDENLMPGKVSITFEDELNR